MTYNGHKNWDYWNVALWIWNDEGLYNLARDLKRGTDYCSAAKAFVDELKDMGITATPDGAKYTYLNVRAALREL